MVTRAMFLHLQHSVRAQFGFLKMIWRRYDLFVPMLSIWVASFGGGEHASVTTYYLLEVGSTTEQLGNFGVIATSGALLLMPVYGWLFDHGAAYLPVLFTAFCCSFGCLFRGLAPVGHIVMLYACHVVLGIGATSFWNNVNTYAILTTPRDLRSVVVSGFQVQVSTLNLLGTATYPAFDWFLVAGGFKDQLLRYRIHMSICSIFCVFGFFYVLFRFKPAPRMHGDVQEREEAKLDRPVAKMQLVLLLAALVVQAFGETVVTVLWPLHIRKLGWESHEYAYLSIASKLLVIAGNLAYPALVRMLGSRATASGLLVVACLTSAAAFLQPDASLQGQMQHVFNALVFLAVCGVMKVCFQHLATLAVPPALQGRIFALLVVLQSGGSIAGNLFGTRLFDYESAYAGKGATPFLLASSLFALVGFAVAVLLVAPQQCGGAVTTDDSDAAVLGATAEKEQVATNEAAMSPRPDEPAAS